MGKKRTKFALARVLSRFCKLVGTYRWEPKLSPYTIASEALCKIGYAKPTGVTDRNHVTKHADVIGEYIKGKKPPITEKQKKVLSQKKNDDFYSSRAWLELRYKILQKYKATCMCCGATRADGTQIHVDHIKPRFKYPELALDINNLQVLCAECNRGKSYKDDTDWRTDVDETK